MKLYRNEKGQKLYPVCRWEENQHKIYYFHDKSAIRVYEERTDEAYAELENIERILDAFEKHIIDGFVYATYEDSVLIKERIAIYNAVH